ncbi:class I SAM-dependent methyltransferase [Streptomyces sp. NPDC001552]|uniref:class I SAM-dependent methyltransferase n=1 Tax=Streptomyces sp. NPDC001552 TaxID=3364587 RepID=UPI0036C23B66
MGCGTGVWTQFLRSPVVALDQSAEMLELTHARAPWGKRVRALFPPLPFATGAFHRMVTANFYGLLRPAERAAFLAEARRTARELIVIDLRSDGDLHEEKIELRSVADTTYPIHRRRFNPAEPALGAERRADARGALLPRCPGHGASGVSRVIRCDSPAVSPSSGTANIRRTRPSISRCTAL